MSFSYLTFLHHPIASLAFFSLILAFISLWIHKKTWLWASFLVVTFAFAFYAHLIDLKVFVALGFLAGFHLILATKVTGWMRLTAFVLAFAVSIALMGHFIPGFHNWKLLDGVQISKDAYPYTLYLNMDKPFVGFFPLAFTIPLIASKFHLRSIAFKTVILAILGTLVLLVLSLYLGVIAIDLKFPRSAFIYMIANLFLVTFLKRLFSAVFCKGKLTNISKQNGRDRLAS